MSSHLPPKSEILVEGISIAAHVLEDGSWALNDEMVAQACGVSPITIRKKFMQYKDAQHEGLWLRLRGRRYWTREGLIELAQQLTSEKAGALVVAFGVMSRHRTRIESSVMEIIAAAFNGVVPLQFQYQVLGFRVDVYFPTLNLAIEIDEHGHGGYSMKDEILRQLIIEVKADCEFIRWNPHLLGQNVGNLINFILQRIIKAGTTGPCGLTIHSSRNRFAVRLNSGVRPH